MLRTKEELDEWMERWSGAIICGGPFTMIFGGILVIRVLVCESLRRGDERREEIVGMV